MIKDLLWPEVNPCPLGVKRQDVKISHLGTSDTSVHQKKNNKLSIMTTGSCPPDETSLGVGQVQSYLQITTAWLGLTIPTPSGKQCQGRGSQDDDDYTSNIFILEAPLNRKTTMGNVMNPADRSMPAQTTVLQSQNFKICVINSGTIMSCVINSGTIIILCQNHLTADHTSVA